MDGSSRSIFWATLSTTSSYVCNFDLSNHYTKSVNSQQSTGSYYINQAIQKKNSQFQTEFIFFRSVQRSKMNNLTIFHIFQKRRNIRISVFLSTMSLVKFLEANDVPIFNLKRKKVISFTYRITTYVNKNVGTHTWLVLNEARFSRRSHMTCGSNFISWWMMDKNSRSFMKAHKILIL